VAAGARASARDDHSYSGGMVGSLGLARGPKGCGPYSQEYTGGLLV
jgi:hypothetical protein